MPYTPNSTATLPIGKTAYQNYTRYPKKLCNPLGYTPNGVNSLFGGVFLVVVVCSFRFSFACCPRCVVVALVLLRCLSAPCCPRLLGFWLGVRPGSALVGFVGSAFVVCRFARVLSCGCCRSCPLSGLFRSVRPSSFPPCFWGVGSLGLRVRFLSLGGSVGLVRLGGSSCRGRSPFRGCVVRLGLGFCSKPTKHNNRPDFNTCTDFNTCPDFGNRGTNPPCALRALWRGQAPAIFTNTLDISKQL